MRLAGRRMSLNATEVLLFQVGEGWYGVDLSSVAGVVQDLPREYREERVWFQGEEIPLYGASAFLPGERPAAQAGAALVLRDGAGCFALAVDGTRGVVEVTPGAALYAVPPRRSADTAPCRPWATWDTGSRTVILLDFSTATVH